MPAPPTTALLIVDMISNWQFEDGERLLAAAADIAGRIHDARACCRRRGMPVIYANDNHGRWRSDFHQQLEHARQAGGEAARIAELLEPDADDYFVLKPRHSAFFATPLDLLLDDLQVHSLVLTGVTTDQCVLMTAVDARMHDRRTQVLADATATLTTPRHDRALLHLRDVLRVPTPTCQAWCDAPDDPPADARR